MNNKTRTIKRQKKDSSSDLIEALGKLLPLLKDQKEDDAVEDLTSCIEQLKTSTVGSDAFDKTIEKVVDAFEGDHELAAYTLQRSKASTEWTEAEELALVSSRVLNLARRMRKKLS